jgi:hypothetical protein
MKRQADDFHKTFWDVYEGDKPLFLWGLAWIIFNLILLSIHL